MILICQKSHKLLSLTHVRLMGLIVIVPWQPCLSQATTPPHQGPNPPRNKLWAKNHFVQHMKFIIILCWTWTWLDLNRRLSGLSKQFLFIVVRYPSKWMALLKLPSPNWKNIEFRTVLRFFYFFFKNLYLSVVVCGTRKQKPGGATEQLYIRSLGSCCCYD